MNTSGMRAAIYLRVSRDILKVAAPVGVGSGTVQRVRREMAEQLTEAAWRSPGHSVICTSFVDRYSRPLIGLIARR